MTEKVRRIEGKRKEGWVEAFFCLCYLSFFASCASASCGPSALQDLLPLRHPLPHLPLLLHLPLGLNHWPRSETEETMKERETTRE